MEMTLKPSQKRRLACEQAIYRRFNNMEECIQACRRYADAHNLDIGFSKHSVRQYVGAYTNFSMKRLTVLAAVLGVTNLIEIDEVFTAPKYRGEGLEWIGERGHRVKDFDLGNMK